MNDHEVRISVMTEPYHWHRHPDSDETFLAVEGGLFIDFDDQTTEVLPGQMVTVPRGVRHRTSSAVATTGNGSEGQWFTDLINFVNSSYALTTANNSGIPVSHLQWTYWALNVEDGDGLLGTSDTGLAYPTKEYSYLCFNQSGPFAVPPGTGSGQCGSTGSLPAPQ